MARRFGYSRVSTSALNQALSLRHPRLFGFRHARAQEACPLTPSSCLFAVPHQSARTYLPKLGSRWQSLSQRRISGEER